MINYVVIHKFMTQIFKLKSTDLLVFALVYGFCQDRDHNGKCEASNKYMADMFGCSSINIQKSLQKLKDKDLIYIKLYKNNSRIIGLNWKTIDNLVFSYSSKFFNIKK